MAGSVNDNEPYYDADDRDANGMADPDADGVAERESDDFVFEQATLTPADPHRTLSFDPHRTLSFDPHRIGEQTNESMRLTPASRTMAERVREARSQSDVVKATAVSPPDLGPCLYFGPAGQRCERRATGGSFCVRHQRKDDGTLGETRSISLPQISKRALGAAGIIAVLWPLLFDLIRELLRFLR